MATVRHWTGREALALRRAMRLSVRTYAAHLGVAQRTVSKWEALGSATTPRPDTQAILDTALGRLDAPAQERFQVLCEDPPGAPQTERNLAAPAADDYENWAEDIERTVVNLSRQNFLSAGNLLSRWLPRLDPNDLDTQGLYLYGRSLVLLADLRRDQGALVGEHSARQTYRRALDVFNELAVPRRTAQIELSLAVVTEMCGDMAAAARRYQQLSTDVRLSHRDRARAQLWVGTALGKDGHHADATTAMRPALAAFEFLDEQDDWSVAQQKLALAFRGGGDLDRASRHIEVALRNGVSVIPMQRVRLTTAQGHILLSDKATSTEGLSLIDDAARLSTEFGLAHQFASITKIRQNFEDSTRRH